MHIVEVSTGEKLPAEVSRVVDADYNGLSEARYFFDWESESNEEVYKLVPKGQSEILGLISIERIPAEWRIHMRLLTVSKENVGNGKIYENITGCLLASVSKLAVSEFGELACVSLRPKNSIAAHYINKYKMNVTGRTLSLEVPEILNLINRYDHD